MPRIVLSFLLVGAGGALGALARYGFGLLVSGRILAERGWPVATFAENVGGGFLMGLLVGWLSLRGAGTQEELRLFLGVGILGGFTTFSAFSLEMFDMIQRGSPGLALLYGAASVILALGALAAGAALFRALA
jgi:CrcB protein